MKQLGKNSKAAQEYLLSRLTESPKIKGDSVELATTRVREAKIILHKFLHHAELEEYRVAVINSGLIEIHKVEIKERRPIDNGGGAPPSTWETVPGQSWNKPSGLSRPGKRSKR